MLPTRSPMQMRGPSRRDWTAVAVAGCGAYLLAYLVGDPVVLFGAAAVALVALVILRQVRAIREDARRHTEAVARRGEERFRSLVQRSSDVILILDAEATIRFASPSLERVFGYSPESVVATPLARLLHPEDAERAAAYLARAASSPGDMPTIVWRLRHRDGSWRHVESAGANLADDATVGGIVLNSRDISERITLEAQLVHQAFHDPLTGLANRALFRDRVQHAQTREGRYPTGIAVLFLDLDDFKTVNDSLGHAHGDRLLVAVAGRLLGATRGSDTVARLGGDEFAMLLENIAGDADAAVVAKRVLAALQTPIELDGREVRVGTSIGIARASGGESADELLRNADVAMYRAKQQGKGGYEIFAPEMHAAVLDRMELEADLRRAIEGQRGEAGEFRLVYQPIVELDTQRLTGIEALVRWEHPRRGVVGPLSFIPIAEETGLIVPLGRWILREACRQLAAWSAEEADGALPAGAAPPFVSVNISGRQLEHPDLVRDVATALAAAGISPGRLVLEITESVVMQNTERMIEGLHALKELGVRLAIDDFGTGYSSLSYLQRFPVDILKIDKAFVDGMAGGGSAVALMRTIIALGQMLSLRTVAEGIEQAEQRDHLRRLGCVLGQGYLFARPLAADTVTALLRSPASAVTPPAPLAGSAGARPGG